MKIVPLSKENLKGVYEIEKTCFSNPWSLEDLAKQIELETSHFYVAEVDNKVVGYMGLQIFSGEGYVTNVAVLPNYRGQGIAKALIAKQFENEMSFITLEVRQSNAPAISLYEKMGFENVGTRPNFYTNPKENAIIMTKYIKQ
jgi:ribosomal-protein-alanine N-acetyltransferase